MSISQDVLNLFLLIGGISVFVIWGVISKILKNRRNREFEEELIRQKFIIDIKVVLDKIIIFFDYKNKSFCVQDNRKFKRVNIHKTTDLVKFVVYDDQDKVIEGSPNTQLKGLYGLKDDDSLKFDDQKIMTTHCFDLRIFIYLHYQNAPAIRLLFIDHARRDTEKYSKQIEKLEETVAALVIIMDIELIDMATERKKDMDTLHQLETMRSEGKITEEEFSTRAGKLAEKYDL